MLTPHVPDPPPTAHLLQGHQFVPCVGVPATDRGFRYGMSIFETVAIHNSSPVFLTAHLDRLGRSAATIPLPPPWREVATHFLTAPPITDGVVRIYITAGDGAPTAPIATPRVIALAESTAPPDQTPVICRTITFTPQPLPAVKTGNYWPHVAALDAARATGAAEAILTTPDGRMISSSMGNIFFQLPTGLVTPPTADGPRDGVVRDWVLTRFPATGCSVLRTDLPSIRAAFLTNSRVGIRPISRIDDHPLSPSPLVEKIATTYQREILDGR